MATGRIAAFAGSAVLAVVGGSFLLTELLRPTNQFADCTQGAVAGGAIGGPFELLDKTGAVRTADDVITKATLVYFGYSFCPDVCPFDVARNATALDILADSGHDVGGVFITVDPERDTPEAAADYAEAHHPDMLGLSGTAEQVARAARAYKVYYKKQPDAEDPDFYLMDHSTFTYLMMPDIGFVDFFRNDLSPTAVAEKVACFVDATA